jgi:2-keto-4-pentenoate hydratase
MTTSDIAAVARAILHARRDHLPCDATPLASALVSHEEAYEVQALVAASLPGEAPAFPRYWKSGGASRDTRLTHAALPPLGVWASPAQAGDWPFTWRYIEVEIALRLGRAVTATQSATLTHDTAPSLIDAMTVSIEIVDSRWQQNIDAPALLKLADLQTHGALVLGEWVPYAPRDWSQQACTIHIGDKPVEQRRGTHALIDPAWVLPAWLSHATRSGDTVPAGTVVTTGTWCGVLPAEAGDLVIARFDGVGEASVQL